MYFERYCAQNGKIVKLITSLQMFDIIFKLYTKTDGASLSISHLVICIKTSDYSLYKNIVKSEWLYLNANGRNWVCSYSKKNKMKYALFFLLVVYLKSWHKNSRNSTRKNKFSAWITFLLFAHQVSPRSDPILLCLCRIKGPESFCIKILIYLS